jgi:uncharacterized membrane protein
MRTPLILVSLLLLGLTLLSLLMPWYTRPELFFGVTVHPEFRRSPQARRIARGYRAGICGVAALALGLVFALHLPMGAAMGWLAYALGNLAILIAAHHAASRYASPRAPAVEVDLNAKPEHMPGGALAPSLPFGWLLALGLWAASNTARLPPRLIVHWGVQGPDRWVETTPQAVLALIAASGLACLLLAITAYGVLHWSRRISTSGQAASSERQFRRLMLLLVLSVEYLIAVLPVFMLLDLPRAAMQTWAVVLWSTLIVFFIWLVRAGQGGSRLAAPAAGATPVGDRTDDAHWLGGIIYFNHADPSLFVERRMGIGWTANFGNIWAWVLIACVLAIPLALHIALSRSSLPTANVRAQAQTAALAWLGAVDAGHYTESWDTAATLFRNAVPEARWVSNVSALRGRLGSLKSRNVASMRFASSLPGAPDGEYVVIKFTTSFEHEAAATETVTPMKDSDGQWRVSGYYIN